MVVAGVSVVVVVWGIVVIVEVVEVDAGAAAQPDASTTMASTVPKNLMLSVQRMTN